MCPSDVDKFGSKDPSYFPSVSVKAGLDTMSELNCSEPLKRSKPENEIFIKEYYSDGKY